MTYSLRFTHPPSSFPRAANVRRMSIAHTITPRINRYVMFSALFLYIYRTLQHVRSDRPRDTIVITLFSTHQASVQPKSPYRTLMRAPLAHVPGRYSVAHTPHVSRSTRVTSLAHTNSVLSHRAPSRIANSAHLFHVLTCPARTRVPHSDQNDYPHTHIPRSPA